MHDMITNMMGAGMWGGGPSGLLVVAVLVLGAAALVKYVFSNECSTTPRMAGGEEFQSTNSRRKSCIS
jgi:hypothetical protein